jgi:hypothetical protein
VAGRSRLSYGLQCSGRCRVPPDPPSKSVHETDQATVSAASGPRSRAASGSRPTAGGHGPPATYVSRRGLAGGAYPSKPGIRLRFLLLVPKESDPWNVMRMSERIRSEGCLTYFSLVGEQNQATSHRMGRMFAPRAGLRRYGLAFLATGLDDEEALAPKPHVGWVELSIARRNPPIRLGFCRWYAPTVRP